MQLEHVEADAPGAERGADEILHRILISLISSSRGTCQPSAMGIGEGATVCHGDCAAVSASRPSHGTCEEPLRPACPIWMPMGAFLSLLQTSITRAIAASLWSS